MRKLSSVLSVIFVIFVVVYFFQLDSFDERNGEFSLPYSANAQEPSEDVSAIIEMMQGDENAPVEFVEYASFTCPHCADFHINIYPKLKIDYINKGKIKFVYREVYFDRFGVWASMLARCAGPDRFFGIIDELYRKQSVWADSSKSDIAVRKELEKIGFLAGLTDEKIDQCFQDSDKLKLLIEWFQINSETDKVKSTPSFVINGEKYPNEKDYEKLTAIIDEILEKS